MPRRKVPLVNNEIYHIVLRSVGNTEIFKNENDYYRGIFSIYEFNNGSPLEIWKRRRDRLVEKKKEKFGGSPTPPELVGAVDRRKKVVDIFCFSLMPNHFHLLVKQLKDGGITKFMKKVGGGYANYFNKKYNRKGHLFDQFRAVHMKTDEQLRNVFTYIHCNRISIIQPGWKEAGIKNSKKVINFIENDKWHSYPDYIGGKAFPSVTARNFLSETMGGENDCRQAISDWIIYKKAQDNFEDIVLE